MLKNGLRTLVVNCRCSELNESYAALNHKEAIVMGEALHIKSGWQCNPELPNQVRVSGQGIDARL